MPEAVVGHVDDLPSWTAAQAAFTAWNAGYVLGQGTINSDREALLSPAHGGVRYCWLFAGQGEVWLPAGYRTQEGDGTPLPSEYRPDPLPPEAAEALAAVQVAATAADGVLPEEVRAPVTAILDRWQEQSAAFVGNIDGEVWRLLASGIPPAQWLPGASGAALRWLAAHAGTLGWSSKQVDSWEPVDVGDQVVSRADTPVRIRGALRYWWIEDLDRDTTPVSVTRRLRYLKDTAGGCAPGFDAFRRLPLTWCVEQSACSDQPSAVQGWAGDGRNRVNCHVLNIAAELSRTHYHPQEAIGGGQPQFEMYFALDPASWRLGTAGRPACLSTFPTIGQWSSYQVTDLTPGTIVLIPPDTGHRGCDAFVQIVTLPGFKPRNELYLDSVIRDATHGQAPHNPALAAAEAPSVAAARL